MKIEICDSTGEDFQFVVYAQNDEERIILKMVEKKNMDKDLKFWLHGTCHSVGSKGVDYFNFGFVKIKEYHDIPVSERQCGCLVKDSESHCLIHNKTDKKKDMCKTETFQKGMIFFTHAVGCLGKSIISSICITCHQCKRTMSI